MKQYQSYKSSGVEWIGEIPEHWIKTKFKYETTKSVQYGLNTNSEKYVDDGIRFLRYIELCGSGEFPYSTDIFRKNQFGGW